MLKAEAINQAYDQIRISGLTTQQVPEEVIIALRELDQLMYQWRVLGRDVNYNFPPPTTGDERVLSDPAEAMGVFDWAQAGVIASLAKNLVTYFGKAVPTSLAAVARVGLRTIMQQTFRSEDNPYPHRMPIGSGNRLRNVGYLARFYAPAYKGRGQQTEILVTQNLDLTCDFTLELAEGDALASYTIEADNRGGVTLQSHSRDGNVISFRVIADAENGRDGSVEIVGTTDNGLIIPKKICFDTVENKCLVTREHIHHG